MPDTPSTVSGFGLTRMPLLVAIPSGSTCKPSIFISRRTRLAVPSAIVLRATRGFSLTSFVLLLIAATYEHVHEFLGELEVVRAQLVHVAVELAGGARSLRRVRSPQQIVRRHVQGAGQALEVVERRLAGARPHNAGRTGGAGG